MIVRLWRAEVDPERRREFEQFEEAQLAPLLEQRQGFGGVLFLKQNDELTVLTLWDGRETAEAFNESEAVQRLTQQVREQGFLRTEPRIEIFDITAGSFR